MAATHFFGAPFFGGEFFFSGVVVVVTDTHDPGIRKRRRRIEERDRLIAQIKRAMGEPEPDALVAEALAPYRAPSDGTAAHVYRIEADLLAALSARLDALEAERRARDDEDDDDFILMAIH